MKKLFFTAIAMVAFSGVSMANTIADNETIIENEKKANESQIETKKDDRVNCVNWAINMMDIMDPDNTMGDVQAWMVYTTLLTNCQNQ